MNKECICEDNDAYTCYYMRYIAAFHKKYPNEEREPEIDDVLGTEFDYCSCVCHRMDDDSTEYLKKDDIRPRDVKPLDTD